jgi:hypothetical protein
VETSRISLFSNLMEFKKEDVVSSKRDQIMTEEIEKLFDSLMEVRREKSRSYGSSGRVISKIMEVIKEEFGEINPDVPMGEVHYAMEILTKWLRYWKLSIVDYDKDHESPLLDLIVYAAMIHVGDCSPV